MSIKKKTKREMYAELLVLATNDEQRKFIEHEIELLDNKNGSRKPTATQVENEKIKTDILNSMKLGKSYTVTEIMKMVGVESNQKASSLIRQLKDNGLVDRAEIKGRAYFSKVEG